MVGAVVGLFAGPVAGALVAGAFAAVFLIARVATLLRGIRGLHSGRRAYLSTFGWANRD